MEKEPCQFKELCKMIIERCKKGSKDCCGCEVHKECVQLAAIGCKDGTFAMRILQIVTT